MMKQGPDQETFQKQPADSKMSKSGKMRTKTKKQNKGNVLN